MNNWKPIVAALVIFAAGVVTGGLTVNLRRSVPPAGGAGTPGQRPLEPRTGIAQRWEGQIRDLATRMERELKLTPEQRERVTSIVRESQRRIKTLLDEVSPRAREEIRLMRDRIRQELTTEQRRQFETLSRPREEGPRRGDKAQGPPENRSTDVPPPPHRTAE